VSARGALTRPAGAAALPYAIAWLEKAGSRKGRDGMARFGIPSDNAFGVPMNRIQALAKELGKSHELALALWETGRYEARLLAAYVDEPGRVTATQMDRWRRGFDNWGVVDTLCFVLFDRTRDAWKMVDKWAELEDEFGKRAAYALIWALALHDKTSGDAPFARALVLIARTGGDERHYVKKAVEMALRAVARRSPCPFHRRARSQEEALLQVGPVRHRKRHGVGGRRGKFGCRPAPSRSRHAATLIPPRRPKLSRPHSFRRNHENHRHRGRRAARARRRQRLGAGLLRAQL
jgi:3-methyladenine DNA glycosylase AlkD